MRAEERRQAIRELLQQAAQPVSAGALAARFSVSRQIIVDVSYTHLDVYKRQVTADMSNEEICDALIEVMPTLAVTGLTSAGSEMTWDASGAVSKDPTAVIIENGTYVTP